MRECDNCDKYEPYGKGVRGHEWTKEDEEKMGIHGHIMRLQPTRPHEGTTAERQKAVTSPSVNIGSKGPVKSPTDVGSKTSALHRALYKTATR